MRNLGRLRQNKKLFVALAIVVVVVLGIAGFLMFGRDNISEEEKNKQETRTVIQKVGELYILPKDEDPTVAAITNKSKLDGQEFFSNAKDGDYLIVYSKAKVALIYRQSVNKLVNAGPINADGAQGTNKQSGQ
jgi:hypothetical protein